jgi:glycosyltransferase involved in cell wall biosynthesis
VAFLKRKKVLRIKVAGIYHSDLTLVFIEIMTNTATNIEISEQKLRILLMTSMPWDNACAAYAVRLAECLGKRGHQVDLVVKPGSPAEKAAKKGKHFNYHSISLKSRSPLAIWKNFLKLRQLIKETNPQIINVFQSTEHIFALFAKLGSKAVFVRTRASHRRPKKHLANIFLHSWGADAHVAVADFIVEKHFGRLNIPSEVTALIRPGFDVEEFRTYLPEKKQARAVIGLDQDAQWVGFLARFTQSKGHEIVLQSFAEPLKKNPQKNYRLLMAGIEYDLKIAELVEVSERLGIADKVKFHSGKYADIRDALIAIDLLIIASTSSEAIARVVIEGMSLGVPIVASDLNSVPEILGDVGLLYTPGNCEELTAGMGKMLEDQALRERARVEGPKRVSKKYNLAKQIELTENLFSSLVKN